MKKCNSCNEIKAFDLFYKRGVNQFQHKCKSCEKEYKTANFEKQKESKSNHYKKNTEKIKQRSKIYKSIHRKRMREKLFKTRPMQKVLHYYRSRLNLALKGKVKCNNTIALVGCSLNELKLFLSKKFTTGMSFDNYGKWHIDHIIPCSKFDFNKVEDQKICFHYTNLQPLWAIDNILKSDKNPINYQMSMPL